MTWFKLDDQFHSHPKVIAAGNSAVGLYCRLGTYCADKLTDGFVPQAVAKSMGTAKEIRALTVCPIPDTRPLLKVVTGGYLLADYLEYNPTREYVLAEREKAKARMGRVRQGKRSGEVRPNNGENFAGSSDAPDPDPPVVHTQETDDCEHPTGSSSSVDIAFRIAAHAIYLQNASRVDGKPERYVAGVMAKMRAERMLDALRIVRNGETDPVQIAGALIESDAAAGRAAHELGLLPDWTPPRRPYDDPVAVCPDCLLCDGTGWVQVDHNTSDYCPNRPDRKARPA